jgi:hypothetical protein
MPNAENASGEWQNDNGQSNQQSSIVNPIVNRQSSIANRQSPIGQSPIANPSIGSLQSAIGNG